MMLSDFLELAPEEQEISLFYEGFAVSGKQDSLGCMLGNDVYNGIVINVEAEDNVLKVWVKENVCKNA